jgi:hypothetical protein
MAPEGTTECQHEKATLLAGFRSPNAVEIARYLCNRVLHELGSGTMIVKQGPCLLTRLFPDLMAGQSHVPSNRSSCLIDVPIPPNKYSPYTCHTTPHPWVNNLKIEVGNHIRARRRCWPREMRVVGNVLARQRRLSRPPVPPAFTRDQSGDGTLRKRLSENGRNTGQNGRWKRCPVGLSGHYQSSGPL